LKRIIVLVLVLTFLLSACAEAEPGLFITVYYSCSDSVKDKSMAIGKESREVREGADILETALSAVMSRPLDGSLRSPFPEEVTLLSHNIDGSAIKLYMSDTYADMPQGDKVIARACLVLTLCALEGIDSVSVFVGDVPDISGVKAEDIEVVNTELNPHKKQIRLFFAHSSGTLMEERRDITIDDDRELAYYVMEELLSGPASDELYSAIPEGSRLLSLIVEGRTCIVDLSHEFIDNKPQSEPEEELAIYSIVNSLTALTTIDRVQFLVEGKRLEQYYSIEIFNPITSDTDITARPAG